MPHNIQPLVCICIPIYNAEATIKETLTSIVNQSYRNLVIQLIDNASTDRTVAIIETFDDPRISIHRNDINIGGEKNFDRCIELAKGKYTAIYHADDVYESRMVEKQVAFLEANLEAGAVFTEASLINENGKMIGNIHLPRGVASIGGLYKFTDIFKAVLQHSNFLICPSAMVRTAVYQREIQCWRWGLFGSSADLDVWLRILQRHPIGILPESLMRYRISASQWTARVRLEAARADFFRVVDHYLAQGKIRAMLSPQDLKNYSRLDRRDRVVRAINLFLTDRPEEAKKLCHDIFTLDGIFSAFQSKRGLITLFVGLYVKLLIYSGMDKFGKISLAFLKRVTYK